MTATASTSVAITNQAEGTGDYAGTVGRSLRIEAIEIAVVPTADNDFYEAQQSAISTIRNYLDLSKYTINAADVQEIIEAQVERIEALSLAKENSVEDINNIVTDAKRELGKVASDEKINSDRNTAYDTYLGLINNVLEEKLNVKVRTTNTVLKAESDIVAAIAGAKARLETATTAEDIKSNYLTGASGIVTAVSEYVKAYVNNIYENGLVEGNTKYLLDSSRCEALLVAIDEATNSTSLDNGGKLDALIQVLNGKNGIATDKTYDGNIGTDKTVGHAIQAVSTWVNSYKNSLYTGLKKYTDTSKAATYTVKGIEKAVLTEAGYTVSGDYVKTTGLKLLEIGNNSATNTAAIAKLDAMLANPNSVNNVAQVKKVVDDAEAAYLSSLRMLANNLYNVVHNKEEYTASKDNAMHGEAGSDTATIESLVEKINAVFNEE